MSEPLTVEEHSDIAARYLCARRDLHWFVARYWTAFPVEGPLSQRIERVCFIFHDSMRANLVNLAHDAPATREQVRELSGLYHAKATPDHRRLPPGRRKTPLTLDEHKEIARCLRAAHDLASHLSTRISRETRAGSTWAVIKLADEGVRLLRQIIRELEAAMLRDFPDADFRKVYSRRGPRREIANRVQLQA